MSRTGMVTSLRLVPTRCGGGATASQSQWESFCFTRSSSVATLYHFGSQWTPALSRRAQGLGLLVRCPERANSFGQLRRGHRERDGVQVPRDAVVGLMSLNQVRLGDGQSSHCGPAHWQGMGASAVADICTQRSSPQHQGGVLWLSITSIRRPEIPRYVELVIRRTARSVVPLATPRTRLLAMRSTPESWRTTSSLVPSRHLSESFQ